MVPTLLIKQLCDCLKAISSLHFYILINSLSYLQSLSFILHRNKIALNVIVKTKDIFLLCILKDVWVDLWPSQEEIAIFVLQNRTHLQFRAVAAWKRFKIGPWELKTHKPTRYSEDYTTEQEIHKFMSRIVLSIRNEYFASFSWPDSIAISALLFQV